MRTLWVAILALSFIWQPIAMAATRAHETEHLLILGHPLHAQHTIPGVPDDESQPSEANDPWHCLMHIGQCCGHYVALPSGLPRAVAPSHGNSAPMWSDEAVQGHVPSRPLRPPIDD